MLRFAQHDNRGVITGHAERSEAESKHLSAPMPNVQWITVVYLDFDISLQFLYSGRNSCALCYLFDEFQHFVYFADTNHN